MDLESTLGDRRFARIAYAVGAFVEFAQCACYFLGLPQELLVSGHLGEALDCDARAVADSLAEGDAAGGIGRRRQVRSAGVKVPLLGKQDLTDVFSHPHSLPAALVETPRALLRIARCQAWRVHSETEPTIWLSI